MEVIETLKDGLKRAYKVTVPAANLAEKVEAELVGMKDRVRINGFRPGKVPLGHLKRLYGRSVMADLVNKTVGEVNAKIATDNAIKFAAEPKVDIEGGEEGVTAILDGKADFSWVVNLEVLPTFEIGDLSGIKINRPVAEVPEAAIDEQIQLLARRNVSYTTAAKAAEKFDRVVLDFVGTIDGEAFEGGTGSDINVDIGSNTFIPGFEDQLLGVKAGDTKTVNVQFPGNYMAQNLAGKHASFAVTVKDVQLAGELTIDDELAKSVGLETLDTLKEAVRGSLQRDAEMATRRKVKRQLLDALDAKFDFDLPPTLLEQEFQTVWKQVETDMKMMNRTFEDEKTTEEAAKEDYRKIAARRVRLGLVLAEIGDNAKVEITEDELRAALIERARNFPGQEKAVWDYYTKNAQALASLRAPIFEDKVVDHLLAMAEITDTPVSRDALLADEDDDAVKAA